MTHPANLDPLLLALVEKLPRPDDVFTTGDKERWLAAMDAALGLLYAPEWSQEARSRLRLSNARNKEGAGRSETQSGSRPVDGRVVVDVSVGHDNGEDVESGDVWNFDAPASDSAGIAGGAADLNAQNLAGNQHDQITGGGGTPRLKDLQPSTQEVAHNQPLAPRPLGAGIAEGFHGGEGSGSIKEAPSTTSADAVDDDSGDGSLTSPPPTPTGAGPAPDTSSLPPAGPESAPTSPSSGGPARDKPKIGDTRQPERIEPGTLRTRGVRKRTFNAAEKGAFVRRAVREGVQAVATDSGIHPTTINRWMREMPKSVERFEAEWAADQAQAEAGPTVAELEAEKAAPVPKPEVKWPSGPMERRPIDPERVRRAQADAS